MGETVIFKDGFGTMPLAPTPVTPFEGGYLTWSRRWFREGRSVVPFPRGTASERCVLWTPAADGADLRVKGARAIWAFRSYLAHVAAARTRAREDQPDVPANPDETAERLLRAYLTADQRLTLASGGYFDMEAPSGRCYRICRDTMQNVYRYIGDHQMQYCAVPVADGEYPDHEYPVGDMMLAQKLMIENDEPRFLDTARKWGSEPSLWTPEGEEDAC